MRRFALSLLAAAVCTLCASAQQQPRSANWGGVNQLAPGAEIRVTLAGGKTLRGFLQSTTPDSLVINATTSQETLQRDDIRRIQVKRPGHRGRNTLIGLGIGTAGGLAAGAGIDAKTNDDWFPNAGKAVLAPIGAIIGTVVGVAMPTGGWRDVYRVK